MSDFRRKHTFEQRLSEAKRIKEKYPARIPVIVSAADSLPSLDKKKYLVPGDLTCSQFLYVLRRRIKLSPEKAMFMFIGRGVLAPSSALVSDVYPKYRDPDQFLYVAISGENTFGR